MGEGESRRLVIAGLPPTLVRPVVTKGAIRESVAIRVLARDVDVDVDVAAEAEAMEVVARVSSREAATVASAVAIGPWRR